MTISERMSRANTTPIRILVSIVMAVVHSTAVLAAMLLRGWEPTPMQFKVLAGDTGAILMMMGFDVLQFAAKRFSDIGYARARHRSPVHVDAPSTVEVTQAGETITAAVTSVTPSVPRTTLAGE